MLKQRFLLWIIVCVSFIIAFGGPAGAATDYLSDDFYDYEKGSENVPDPLEPLNRIIFDVNDKIYIWVMEPVATYYSYAVPYDLRDGIRNFFRNLEEPVRFVNTLLQGRFSDAGTVLARFVINTTFGVYGFGDAASRVFEYYPIHASLGETLATWGIRDGFYMVVPLLGPSTLRDFTGKVVDGFGMTPYYTWTDDIAVMGGVYVGKQTNTLSMHLGEYEDLKNVLFDPYIAFRNAYFQNRRRLRDHSGTDSSGMEDELYPVPE